MTAPNIVETLSVGLYGIESAVVSAEKPPISHKRPVMLEIPNKPQAELSDEALLAAHLAGDSGAFARLVERYQRELFHFLSRFLGDRNLADDVFQETFIQVHQSAAQFDPHRKFRPWLFTIAANKARDIMRMQQRKHTSPLEAAINRGDEESGRFVDLMQSEDVLPGAEMEKEELQTLV